MASCTSPALVHTSQVADGWDAEKSQSLVHTPSTACPTPRTPVSRNLLPPLALPEPITYSREAQPFWWPMSEGDEGALSSPLNEPSMGMQGDCRFGDLALRAFGRAEGIDSKEVLADGSGNPGFTGWLIGVDFCMGSCAFVPRFSSQDRSGTQTDKGFAGPRRLPNKSQGGFWDVFRAFGTVLGLLGCEARGFWEFGWVR